MPRILLEGVRKSFVAPDGESVRAVDGLTLAVADRELLALVGPSGCGKTTTLRLVAGLETADAGRILFNDQPVTTRPPIDRDVAMVFQSHALFPHLSAFDNLAFGLKIRHVSKPEIHSRVCETAEMLGVAHCLERNPGELSGGERQRIALGRALARRPRILLLDEPLSHLDEPLRLQMQQDLQTLRSRLAMTVIYVTHDQAEALALGDQVAVLNAGRIQQIGTPREIYNAPANTFVAGFVGSPPMNLLPGTVAQHDGQFVLVGADSTSAAPVETFMLPLSGWRADWFSQHLGHRVILGIRPESVGFSGNAAPANPAETLAAVVQSIHYLGAESLVRLVAGSRKIVARTKAALTIRSGQTTALTFDLTHAHVYDAGTGALLF
jgi:multiple sugar transport system ATP-binding protein